MDENNLQVSTYNTSLTRAIKSVPEDFWEMKEGDVISKYNPTVRMHELKKNFYVEFTAAQRDGRPMSNTAIYKGLITRNYYHNKVLKNPLAVRWLLLPVVDYEKRTTAALDKAVERYDELIDMDVTTQRRVHIKNENGEGYRWEYVREVCPKKAMVLLTVIKNLEERVKGTAISKNININTNSPESDAEETVSIDMEKVNKRIKELEEKLNPEVIDVI